ncbi:MAG: M1 family metallopeptidase [Psychroflexus sp.]|nr:M1 family metallopeptidase [Psychroflexus sp.]
MKLIFTAFIVSISLNLSAQLLNQNNKYTKADTLRGSLRPERTAFDMLKYSLSINVNPKTKKISGYNTIKFKVLMNQDLMQLDLFENMTIDSIVFQGEHLKYNREYNAVFIDFKNQLKNDSIHELKFYYHGKPTIAKNPPWDGGFVFEKDNNGKPWIAVAVQGTGASLWYPNKDHLSDETDSAEIKITVPENLTAVSNGRLVNQIQNQDSNLKTFHWQVTYPINNYNITLNIGDYVHFSDQFQDLDLEYYVLRDNLDKAKKHFEQVKPMMSCFYDKLGEYPFKNDSFKLVETPYLGMEHQSAVAYGNKYLNGYMGGDLSGTGYGLKFDYLIIHESAHEWFGNSISVKDIADLWIHEGFTTYAESIFVECEYGKKAALDYIYGQRQMISNNRALVGEYGVNHEGSSDMYAKGSNMINTLRTLLGDDDLWWKTLKDFNQEFAYKTTTTKEVVRFFSQSLNKDLTAFFKQYLYHKAIPELVFKSDPQSNKVKYKWDVNVKDFNMPVELKIDKNTKRIYPEAETWKALKIEPEQVIEIDEKQFYIDVKFAN